MIDFSNTIFNTVATAVRNKHIGIKVVGENVRDPSEFPTLTVDEIGNVDVDYLEDSSHEETFARLTYRVQVFSNKQGYKKSEARSIFDTANSEMRKMGFRRIAYTTTPEIYNSTIYNITAIYEGIVSKGGCVYKR